MKAAYVLVDGPISGGICQYSGDEFPVWTVTLFTDDDTALKTYTCRSGKKAYYLGERIANDKNIEFVNESLIHA